MIFPDVNILLYAYDRSSKFHSIAKKWLEDALSDKEVSFSWHTITGFLRILTHPSILSSPASLDEAVRVVNDWLERENTHLIAFEKRNWPRGKVRKIVMPCVSSYSTIRKSQESR